MSDKEQQQSISSSSEEEEPQSPQRKQPSEQPQQKEKVPSPVKEEKLQSKKQEEVQQKPKEDKQSDSSESEQQETRRQPKKPQQRASKILMQYKYNQKFDFSLNNLKQPEILEEFQYSIDNQFTEQLPFENDIVLKAEASQILGGGLNRHIGYIMRGKDKNGEKEFIRRYTEFVLLRNRLTEQWPGLIFPLLPNQTLIGNSEPQIIKKRKTIINHFLRKLSCYPYIYYGEQVQAFIKSPPEQDIQELLATFKILKYDQMLEKYKELFPDLIKQAEDHVDQRFQIGNQLKIFQDYFGEKRINLVQYKSQIKRLQEAKTKYFKTMSKLDQHLLPEYEEVLIKWFNGEEIDSSATQSKEQNKQKQAQIIPGITNSQQFKSKLEDTAGQIGDYNRPLEILYDIFKFELKDLDSVSQAIEQVKYVRKQEAYFKRNIDGNKEQIESLNSHKTTLKNFFMSGSQDQKKTQITNQTIKFEEKYERIKLFHSIVLTIFWDELKKYHEERIKYYHQYIRKFLNDELAIVKSVMEFHIFEFQELGKELQKKLKGTNAEEQNSDKQ